MERKFVSLRNLAVLMIGMVFSSPVNAMGDGDFIVMTLLFSIVGLFVYWFASVLVLFGLSYLKAMLASLLIFLISCFVALETTQLFTPKYPKQRLERTSKLDPSRGMNLS